MHTIKMILNEDYKRKFEAMKIDIPGAGFGLLKDI